VGTYAGFDGPTDVFISEDGSWAVSVCQRGHRIRHMVLSEASFTTVAGDGVVGSSNGIGKYARFRAPSSVHLIYGSKLLLIADRDNHQLRLMDTFSSVVTTVVGSGSAGHADGIGTMAALSAPHFIAVSSRNVFAVVSDVGSHCLRLVVLSTWSVSTLAGSSTGTNGFLDGLGTLALFDDPGAVVLSSDDSYLFVADGSNNKIRRVTILDGHVLTLISQQDSVPQRQPIGVSWLVQDSVLLISNNGDDSSLLQMRSRCAFTDSTDVSSMSVSVISHSASEFAITATAFINEPHLTPPLEIERRLATTESFFGVLTVAGSLWTQATAAAGWTARHVHASVVFDNKMWVLGGYNTARRNDVWYSSNGVS
jgi:hypothetical protein